VKLDTFRKFYFIIIIIICLSIGNPTLARAGHGITSDKDKAFFEQVNYDQKLNAQLPLHLAFQDEAGQTVYLNDYFGEKPVILVMAYYECPMLCTLVLNGVLNGFDKLDFNVGNEFNVITVSIDPNETPAMATAKKETYIRAYDRAEAAAGWHFLTGDQTAIEQLTEAIGFHYVYDPDQEEYAHPTGLVVLTPQGRISRYLYGIEFSPTDLRLGLVEASANKIGSPIDQVLLMCYHYDPDTGQYTPAIMNIIRVAGIATTLIIGIPILTMVYRNLQERKRNQL
jgi:protein SCO1/2